MEKTNIKCLKFEDICEMTKFDYNGITMDTIIEQCEYLKDKRVLDNNVRIEEPLGRFLYLTMERAYLSPDYSKAARDFLESDYFSTIMKENIAKLLRIAQAPAGLMELLKSDVPVNEFTREQLSAIKRLLDRAFTDTYIQGELVNNVYEMFDDYMFLLDGQGPVDYIKSKFNEKELGLEILKHSGLIRTRSSYPGSRVQRIYLSEKHLISLYKKIDKYMPETKFEFLKLVSSIDTLTAPNFVGNFTRFANNGFTTVGMDFTPVLTGTEPVKNPSTIDVKLSEEAVALDRQYEQMAHSIILKNFKEAVIKYETEKTEVKKPTAK